MKPNFALNITDSAISLLHRTSRGWLEVGSAAFDSPDLEEALGYLRSSALGLSPHGITTKLILPPSQVLYAEVEAPGPDKASREAQIRTALEGKTPYAVEDLVFDWWGTGPKVQVAVVARETLEEAEAFAEAHRFGPVSFVTIPANGQFAGEPWFGAAKGAAALLPEGEKVTRDQDPVTIISRDVPKAVAPDTPEVAEAEVMEAEVAEQMPPADTSADIEAQAEAERAAEAEAQAAREAQEAARRAEAEAEAKAARDAEAAASAAKAEADAKAAAEAEASREAEEAARQKAEAARAEMEARAQELAQAEAKRLVEEAEKTKAAMQEREKARAALIEAERKRAASPQAAAEEASAAFNGVTSPDIAEPADKTPPAAPTFASRRREDGATAAPNLGPATPTVVVKPPSPVAAEKPKPTGPASPVVTSIAAGKPVTASPTLAKPVNGTAAFPQGARPQLGIADKGAPTKSGTDKAKAAAAAMVTASRIPGKATALSRFKSKVTPDPKGTPEDKKASPANARGDASMGKMGAKLATRRGKPRFLGLILTLVLLAVLAAIAAWSSIYLSRNDTTPDPVQVASAPTGTDAPTAAATPVEAEIAADTVSEAEAVADAEAELPPAEEIANVPVPDVTGPAPQVDTSDTAAQTEGPGRGPQDEILLAGTDGQPPAFDAVALPRPQVRPDGAPDAPMPPPPFGTQYEFDAEGQIKATENGVVMPDGFWLIAAQPPVLPPARPAAIAPSTAVAPDAVAQDAGALATPPPANPAADAAAASTAGLDQQEGGSPSSAFAGDASVPDSRPRSRPASLDAATQAPTQAEDDASLANSDPAIARLASLRPRIRPQSILVAAEAARKAVEAASLAATAAAESKAEQDSILTVSLSPRPAKRPQDFSRAVAAAVSAATRETSRNQAATPAATARAAEPEEEHEPEVKVSAAPRIPTRANVASQATFKNAINLSKTNLIGVYGKDNSRYALIRTSSGRYNKVRVGDRVDGGTVAAITRTELRYRKGGKMLTLAMPNS